MFVVWDKTAGNLTDDRKREIRDLLKSLNEGDQAEVKGKWSIYVNRKTFQHRKSFLLSSLVKKLGDPAGDDDFPVEKEFNFEETDDHLMLKFLQHKSEINKLDKNTKGRKEVQDFFEQHINKRARVTDNEDDGEDGGDGGEGEGKDEDEDENEDEDEDEAEIVNRRKGSSPGDRSGKLRPEGLGKSNRKDAARIDNVRPQGSKQVFEVPESQKQVSEGTSMLVDG
ncbi:MAG: hypothetical protein JOS17DRAFT_780799 [Linnemannia elongata]|nr:MAG: hypothetical protein JOS17DRAFT_780799 [Linnemannia elongata]